MKRPITVLEAIAAGGIVLEGLAAAFILSAVREFDCDVLLGTAGIAVTGFMLGLVVRTARGLTAAAITTATIAVVAALSLILFSIASLDKAIVVAGLGLVLVCAAEVTRLVLPFTSIGGLK